MVNLEFTSGNMLTPEEVAQSLQEIGNPIDELLELSDCLRTYERKYEMDSGEFITRYTSGELGDALDFVEWAGLYHIFERLRQKIENASFS